MKALFAWFIKDTNFLVQFTKMCQTDTVEDYIDVFERLVVRTKSLTD